MKRNVVFNVFVTENEIGPFSSLICSPMGQAPCKVVLYMDSLISQQSDKVHTA